MLRLVEALRAQDYPRRLVEWIAVDGHSTDGTRERLEAEGFRVLLDGGISAAEARNRGILAARGVIVAFTDGDCRPSPCWLSALVARFDDPRVGGAGGAMRVGPRHLPAARVDDLSSRAEYRGFITSNVAYRRDVLLHVGGFEPTLRCGEDWEVWWRVLDEGWRVEYVPEAVVEHEPAEMASIESYLRKNAWYGRGDVAMFRARGRVMFARWARGRRATLREPFHLVKAAAFDAALPPLVFAAPFLWPARVALGVLLARSAWRTMRGARGRVPPDEAWALARLAAAKAFVRGVGTWRGVRDVLADVARGRSEPLPGPRAPEHAPRRPAPSP